MKALVIKLNSAFIILFLIFIVSCKKQKNTDEPSNQLTPYTLKIPFGFPAMPEAIDNPITVEGIALGKQLFFEPILSGNNKLSCASCHIQNFSFSDTNVRFSRGIDNKIGTRNTMPILNLGWAKNFFWDGGAANLESQVIGPIQNPVEMNQNLADLLIELNNHPDYPAKFKKVFGEEKIGTAMIMKAIAQFERTLISGNSKFDQFKQGKISLTAQESRGMNLFRDQQKGDCSHCHVLGSTFTDFEYRNTGLDSLPIDKGRALITLKLGDEGKFKTPSLRNIELTGPYMHDGRFKTLEECIIHYNIGYKYTQNLDPNLENSKKGRLSNAEIQDLIEFLKTLTDNTFIQNPDFKK